MILRHCSRLSKLGFEQTPLCCSRRDIPSRQLRLPARCQSKAEHRPFISVRGETTIALEAKPKSTRRINHDGVSKAAAGKENPVQVELSNLPPTTSGLHMKFVPLAWGSQALERRAIAPPVTCRQTLFTLKAGPTRISHKAPLVPFYSAFYMAMQRSKSAKMDNFSSQDLPILISFTPHVSKAKTSKSTVVRQKIRRKIQNALQLIICKGARAEQDGTLVLDPSQRGVHYWLHPNLEYALHGCDLEIYSTPTTELIYSLSVALRRVKNAAALKYRELSRTGRNSSDSEILMSEQNKVLEEVVAKRKNRVSLAERLRSRAH